MLINIFLKLVDSEGKTLIFALLERSERDMHYRLPEIQISGKISYLASENLSLRT